MPFFVDGEYLERLEQDNARMTETLGEFEDMSGVILLAQSLRGEIIRHMEENPYASPREIGELAYRGVFESEVAKARDEIIERYQHEHRSMLYDQVIQEVEKSEGKEILSEVREKLDTDPELAVELRDSARKELAARALDVVRSEITAEQQAVIDVEAERLLGLDRLDVEFAVNGELALLRDDVLALLQPGDHLTLHYAGASRTKGKVIVEWTSDVNEALGWVIVSMDADVVDSYGYKKELPRDHFIIVGSEMPDLVEGGTKHVPNLLKTGQLISLTQEVKGGKLKPLVINHRQRPDMLLTRIDFQTRILDFNKS